MDQLRAELFSLAETWRKQFPEVKICALTGSSGKTSTKEMLAQILKTFGKTISSVENYNTKPALAGDVFKLKEGIQFGVFEVGLRKPGDLKIPLHFLRPQVTGCLNVGSAHREFFKSDEELVQEKCRIFTESPDTHSVVIPDDDPRILSFAKASGRQVFLFGRSAQATTRISRTDFDLSQRSTLVEIEIDNKTFHFRLAGLHIKKAEHLAASLSFCLALGLDINLLPEDLTFLTTPPQRFEVTCHRGLYFVDDSFNANPESLQAALESLETIFGDRSKVFVLGSMKELGATSEFHHQTILQILEKKLGPKDAVYLVGHKWKPLPENNRFHFSETTEDLKSPFNSPGNPEVIFLKGSKVHNLKSLKEGWMATL